MTLTRNPTDAEDLLQETLLRAYTKLHLWQEGTNLTAWMVVMMRNLFLSKFAIHTNRATDMIPIEDCEISVPMTQEQAVEIAQVRAIWPSLTEDHREVLETVAVGNASYEEAAETLGIPVGTVRSRLARARHSLRERCGLH